MVLECKEVPFPGVSRNRLLSAIASRDRKLAVVWGDLVVSRTENFRLRLDNAKLLSENDKLRLEIERQAAELKELRGRLSKDSHNSSKPPSSDGLAKKPAPQSLREVGVRLSGGQPGHPGVTLRMSDDPKVTFVHAPSHCTGCGTDLEDVTHFQCEQRQVFDIPDIKVEATEHLRLSKTCPNCGQSHRGVFPEYVTQPVQYGGNIKSFATYLHVYHFLPWKRTTELLSDLLGASFSEGVLQSALKQCDQAVSPIVEEIRHALIKSRVVNCDETGKRIAGKLYWSHVACTDMLTHYKTQTGRGPESIDAVGILPFFNGRAVHDGHKSYWTYTCKHGLCNAHHLRELIYIFERDKQVWADDLAKFLVVVKKEVEKAKGQGHTQLPSEKLSQFHAQFDRLLAMGYAANPAPEIDPVKNRAGAKSDARKLLERLERYHDETLAFMTDFTVPFDNNQAERDVRMIKVRQKVSGCFRTMDGAKTFDRIRGYLSTMHKQGHNILEVLNQAFLGKPVAPIY